MKINLNTNMQSLADHDGNAQFCETTDSVVEASFVL
jgi:hypothetical protein